MMSYGLEAEFGNQATYVQTLIAAGCLQFTTQGRQLSIPVSELLDTDREGEVMVEIRCPPRAFCTVDGVKAVIGASSYGNRLKVGPSFHPIFPGTTQCMDRGALRAYVTVPVGDQNLRFLPRSFEHGNNGGFCDIVVGRETRSSRLESSTGLQQQLHRQQQQNQQQQQ